MSVELILQCKGVEPSHEFKVTYNEPVDWNLINQKLKEKTPRCEMHPEVFDYSSCWE